MGSLTIELELANSVVDCIIDPNNYDESYTDMITDLRNHFTVAVAGDAGKKQIYQLIGKLSAIFVSLIII